MTLVRVNNRNCAPSRSNYASVNPWMNIFWNDFDNRMSDHFVPPANIVETRDDFRIELSVPGFAKDEFKINVENQVLSIKGEHSTESENKDERFVRHEFSRGSFSRNFRLSALVDSLSIQAKYENGILNVVIPKAEEAKTKAARDIRVD